MMTVICLLLWPVRALQYCQEVLDLWLSYRELAKENRRIR